MNEKEIIASAMSIAEKARKLYDLGKTRKEVANMVCGGNYGWAYNIEKAYLQKKEAAKAADTNQEQAEKEKPQQKAKEPAPKPPAPAKKVAAAPVNAPAKEPAKAPAKKTVDPKVIKKSAPANKNKATAKAKAKKGIRR